MELQAILSLLSDGEYHSGKVLGELLGVSRTAVWKHLQKLEAFGVPLESVKGKGYRLPGGLELLESKRIESDLRPLAKSCISELEIFESVDSTNRIAMDRAQQGGAHGFVCLAEHQSAGKGRRGRQWQSPYGQSIYLSAVAEFDGGAAVLEGLSLAVGVALVKALRRVGVKDAALKWPNDVLVNDRKLAGILLEMSGDVAGVCQVVVGVGLNVSVASEMSEIDQPWVDVSELVPGVSRNLLAACVIDELMPVLVFYQQQGFGNYRQTWEELHAYQGQRVTVSTGLESTEGVVLGVSDTGALRLDVKGVEKHFNGGEVSLRVSQ